jgi:hypothetical protein
MTLKMTTCKKHSVQQFFDHDKNLYYWRFLRAHTAEEKSNKNLGQVLQWYEKNLRFGDMTTHHIRSD